jgi:hypothetical protein
VKAIGNSRQAIIFSERLKKDRKFRRDENVLFYAFWIHTAPAATFTWREDLWAALAKGVDRLLIVPFSRINGFLKGRKPTGTIYHPGRVVRDRFYRIPLGDLMRMTATDNRHRFGHPIELPGPAPFGLPMPPIPVYGSVLEHVVQLSSLEIETAGEMAYQLSRERLEVTLCRAPRPQFIGHKVRVVSNRNPDWYRALCAVMPAQRKVPRRRRTIDSRGLRGMTMAALERLAEGRCDTRHCWRMRAIVRQVAGLPAIGH